MNFPYYIARRYLIGKKSRNAINYITGISVAVTSLVTMALIVILSVFNGLSSLISSLYGAFDPDLKITAVQGKYFYPEKIEEILATYDSSISFAPVLEENILLKHKNKQFIGTIKGVGKEFNSVTNIDSILADGEVDFRNEKIPNAAVGQGLAYSLSIGLNFLTPIHVYAPNPKATPNTPPDKAFTHKTIFPTAIFSVQQDIDSKYLITDLSFAQAVLKADNKATAIEIGIKNGADSRQLEKLIKASLPEGFTIKSQQEQHEFLFKVMKSEKWAIYLIVCFILIIASFNIVGSLSMLIIDKRKDINILKSMGAGIQLIKKIFIVEGWMITGTGIVLGLISGIGICLIQEHFGLLELQGSGNFIVSAYPVDMQLPDIVIVVITVSAIGFSAAFYPVSRISQKFLT